MAITTIYKGIEFRSRLEARYAAFFTRLGWPFTYEPFDGDGYIPDFAIHGPRPLLVEIKPAATFGDFEAPIGKVTNGVRAHWPHDLLILGVDPLPILTSDAWPTWPAAGLLGEHDGDGNWTWGTALWFSCGNCGQDGVFHDHMTYAGRPCGCYQGDHYLNEPLSAYIKTLWDDATNDVKWRGRAA